MRLVGIVIAILPTVVAWAGGAEVDPSVHVPYTPRSNPRITAKWGPDALAGINRLRREAAMKVAKFEACNGISTSQLSESRSVTPDTWIVVVACRNGRKFYVSRDDVANGARSMIVPEAGGPA